MLVTELLRRNASLYAGDTALTTVEAGGLIPLNDDSYAARRRTCTWLEFNDSANRLANYYRGMGIGKGNKVGLLLMNSLEWLPIYFGILKSGALAVPLNFRYTAEDIVRSANYAELDALIFGPRCAEAVSKGLDRLPEVRSFLFVGSKEQRPAFAADFRQVDECSAEEPPCDFTGRDDAAIYFSSGTTGAPKAVVYTHATLEAACLREWNHHGQTRDDNFICIPPLYHVGAKLHWMANLLVGARAVLLLGFSVPAFFEAMSREQVTIAFLLLPWVQDILLNLKNGALKPGNYSLEHWRLMHMGAQPIPPCVVRQFRDYFPCLDYDISYGLTESGGPGCLNLGTAHFDKLGSVGLPAAGWAAKVADCSGKELGPGLPGELLLRGPGMMRCYYRNEAATRETLKNGWLHTGDMAKKDTDGFYYLIDRKKDVIISGGENIYPAQIEEFLRGHGAVRDAAVFGLCHKRLGEAVLALAELEPGASCTEEELLEFCRALPKYQQPFKILFGQVPRNPTGKIEKAKLRSRYAAEMPWSPPAEAKTAAE